jgi:anti-anti-sigma factor
MQTRRIDADTAVVALQGELDIYTTPRAKELLLRLLDDGCRYLIVNLREAAYLDSTALGALLGTLRRARERGGGLHLVAPTRAVHRLLEITRLTMAFPIYDTEHEAITIVGRGDGGA